MSNGYTLFVILETKGKISRKCGAMVTLNEQIVFGTIGGGPVERQAIALSKELDAFSLLELSSCSGGKAKIAVFKEVSQSLVDMIKDVNRQISLKIEGEILEIIESPSGVHGETVCQDNNSYIYTLRPRKKLLIVGGGHVGSEVKKLASYMGYETSIYDIHKTPSCDVVIENYSALPDILKLDGDTALVVLTRGIKKETVEALFKKDCFYFGALGHSSYSPLYSPIGLNIGAENVKEVTLSIVSEIEAVYHGEKGGHLKHRDGRLVLVRGAGDLATGVIIALKKAGFRVIATEIEKPTVIRRTVSFAEAVYEESAVVEGVTAQRAESVATAKEILEKGNIPVLLDKDLKVLNEISFDFLVDAIIAKKNLGTKKGMTPFVIALGPGFTAGVDCDVCIETKRGHNLGRLIYKGEATPNTGVPGLIEGFGKERVIHSSTSGVFTGCVKIGDIVKKGDIIATVDKRAQIATMDGMVRGLLRTGLSVSMGFKVADIDPRGCEADYKTVSDKARALGNAVLLAIMEHLSSC